MIRSMSPNGPRNCAMSPLVLHLQDRYPTGAKQKHLQDVMEEAETANQTRNRILISHSSGVCTALLCASVANSLLLPSTHWFVRRISPASHVAALLAGRSFLRAANTAYEAQLLYARTQHDRAHHPS